MTHTDDLAPVIADALHLYQQLAGFRGLAVDSSYLKGLLLDGIPPDDPARCRRDPALPQAPDT